MPYGCQRMFTSLATSGRASRRAAVAALLPVFLAATGCDDGSGYASSVDGGALPTEPLVVSAKTRTPRTTTLSVNYWQWSPTYGDDITGTDALVADLKPALMRVGGYNNDANTPDPFDDAQLDKAVAYAKAIGAEPILQVPHLADVDGQPATPAAGAAMVSYANVTKGYGVKYFAVGNEPDIYDAQGLPSDQTQPAIAGYTTTDYCTSARAYVAAMKAVDPTIQIVGPDLAYKYQVGNPGYDWLTPILTNCGDLFDIVSIHRYPFEAKAATLAAAKADAASFRSVMTKVLGVLATTGQGAKPLALTEMNDVYDATTCVVGASPGTVGSALWMADSLGSAIATGLWTSAVWDVSDGDDFSFGLIGRPPAHTPRPPYYAYLLYAEHFGTSLVAVTTMPSGVSAYASRNEADDETDLIVINWNTTPVALAFKVNDLAAASPSATFALPSVSIAAVAIPDTGAAMAWSYGEAQRRSASGPALLEPGAVPPATGDGGAAHDGGAGKVPAQSCAADAALVCPQVAVTSPTITAMGRASAAGVAFGSGTDAWGSYAYAASGQTAPTGTVTSTADGIHIVGGFVPPVVGDNNYEGFGLYYSSASCLDATAYTGVSFDFSGSLGGCQIQLGVSYSGDDSHLDDPSRGGCPGADSVCYGPSFDVTAAALAANAASPTIQVPFTSLAGGMPNATLDPRTIVTIQWQLTTPDTTADAGGCSADFTVSGVKFY